jgi:alkaline phosphatase
MSFRSIFLVTFLFLCACAHQDTKPKSHIMFIGDGMGSAQITGARLYKGGVKARLYMESLPYTGFLRTYSSDDFVTDSAASGTALATGVKTYNHAISMSDPKQDSQGKSRPLVSILKRAKQAGKSVGIVTTTAITHATPAVYYANASHRKQEEQIAEQLLAAQVDVIIAGGKGFFLPKSSGGKRTDQKNLLQDFKQKGYRIITSNEEFKQTSSKVNQPLIALLESSHLPYELDRRSDQPSLDELVTHAIKHLSQNPNGYFLMVEGGRIDMAAHENLAEKAFADLLAFDKAIGLSLPLAQQDTLIIVTADHETGGLSLNGYAPHEKAQGAQLVSHCLVDSKTKNKALSLVSWATGPGHKSPICPPSQKQNSGLHKSTFYTHKAHHSGVDVPVMAIGPGASQFSGYMDNNELVHKVVELMGLAPLGADHP